eukprot:g5386.t1
MVGLWLKSSSTAGYDSFGPPRDDTPSREPSRSDIVAGNSWGGGVSGWSGDDSSSWVKAGDGDGDRDGDAASGAQRSVAGCGGGGGGRRMTAATGGLLVWATVASLAAVWLAAGRVTTGGVEDYGGGYTHRTAAAGAGAAAAPSPPTADSSASLVATSTMTTPPSPKAKPKSDTWCLPNAAMQNFSGVVLKEEDGLMPRGKWEGQHWWYHDEITSGFHMVVTIGGDTYGFWDLGILGAAGNTEYVAAYKGDECLFYQEEVQPGSSPFDEDVTCRGSAWAGNVTLEEEVEFGYGTQAERWSGTIRDIDNSKAENGGLPTGTESLVDLQRNPKNNGEVRLLYHRVVAPTQGVLGWAGGDSMSFDLVFTGVESMTASDVLELVKVPSICEVMAGEFHDQQARGGNTNTGLSGSGGGRALRRTTKRQTAAASFEASRQNDRAAEAAAAAEGQPETVGPASAWPRPVAPRRAEKGSEAIGAAGSGESRGARAADSPGVVGSDGRRRSTGGSRGARRLARSLQSEAAAEDEDEGSKQEEEEAKERAREGGNGAYVEDYGESNAEPAAAGLLPIHQVLRSLGPRGFRHRG